MPAERRINFRYCALATKWKDEKPHITRYAPTTPTKSASPPPRGIGILLIRRASGLSTIPNRRFISRTSGVRKSVNPRASMNVVR